MEFVEENIITPQFSDIGGDYVWIFRHKWIPCLYSDLTGESLVRVNDQSAINSSNLIEKKVYYLKLIPYTHLQVSC